MLILSTIRILDWAHDQPETIQWQAGDEDNDSATLELAKAQFEPALELSNAEDRPYIELCIKGVQLSIDAIE